MEITKEELKQMGCTRYTPRLRYRLPRPKKKHIAITICVVNVIIPFTAWPVTNPIIYRKITKFEFRKFGRKLRLMFA